MPGNARSALVTGATGFIGSHLVRRLLDEGWSVTCVMRDAPLGPTEAAVDARADSRVHDGTTGGLVSIAGEASPDVAFHLASLFIAEHVTADVTPLVTSNVLFGAQLLEALSIAGCRRLVNTGTSWQHRSGDAYEPVCLYAATKQAFEDLAAYYVSAGVMDMVTLRLFETYGPGDPRRKVVPLLLEAARAGAALSMSPGEQTLDLVYIDDVVGAFVGAGERLAARADAALESYAVRGGGPVSLRELAAAVERATGRPVAVEWGGRPYRAREVMAPWAGGTTVPGWAPAVGLEDGLRRTYAALAPGGGEGAD